MIGTYHALDTDRVLVTVDLARLLAQPGQEIHVADLAAEGREAVATSASAGEVLDAAGKSAYKNRIAELGIDRPSGSAMFGALE